jgi:very-short-patch-repair endonuclease
LRYITQAKFGQYDVDFLLTELDVVVEADGPFGHLSKRDARRDQDLKDMGIAEVWHFREKTLKDIKERLCQELNRYQNQIA